MFLSLFSFPSNFTFLYSHALSALSMSLSLFFFFSLHYSLLLSIFLSLFCCFTYTFHPASPPVLRNRTQHHVVSVEPFRRPNPPHCSASLPPHRQRVQQPRGSGNNATTWSADGTAEHDALWEALRASLSFYGEKLRMKRSRRRRQEEEEEEEGGRVQGPNSFFFFFFFFA